MRLAAGSDDFRPTRAGASEPQEPTYVEEERHGQRERGQHHCDVIQSPLLISEETWRH